MDVKQEKEERNHKPQGEKIRDELLTMARSVLTLIISKGHYNPLNSIHLLHHIEFMRKENQIL